MTDDLETLDLATVPTDALRAFVERLRLHRAAVRHLPRGETHGIDRLTNHLRAQLSPDERAWLAAHDADEAAALVGAEPSE